MKIQLFINNIQTFLIQNTSVVQHSHHIFCGQYDLIIQAKANLFGVIFPNLYTNDIFLFSMYQFWNQQKEHEKFYFGSCDILCMYFLAIGILAMATASCPKWLSACLSHVSSNLIGRKLINATLLLVSITSQLCGRKTTHRQVKKTSHLLCGIGERAG